MKNKNSFFSILFLAILPLAFFHRALFFGEVFYVLDLATEEYSNHFWIKNHFGSLWNPGIFTGAPHLANLQAYGFDLLHLLSLPLPFPWSYNFFIVSHFWVALFGFYLFSRELKQSEGPATFSAMIFTFGGFFISLGHLPILLNTYTYLPWALFSLLKIIQAKNNTERNRATAWLALFLALQWCGGEPQFVLLTLLSLTLLTLFLSPKNIAVALSACAIACLLSVFLAGIQLFPFQEFLAHSNRQITLDWTQSTRWSLQPATLLSFFIPHRLVNPSQIVTWGFGYWEKELPYIWSIHLGLTTLFLIGVASFSKKSRLSWFAITLIVLGIGLALGRHSPLYALGFRFMPGFSHFRFPEKFLGLSHLGLSLLAGLGFSRLSQRDWRNSKLLKALLATSTVGLLLWLQFSPGWIERTFLEPHFGQFYLAGQVCFAGIVICLMLCALLLPKLSMRTWALILLGLLELFRTHLYANPTQSAALYQKIPEAARWLQEKSAEQRILTLKASSIKNQKISRTQSLPLFYAKQREILQPSSAMQFALRDLMASNSLHLEGLDRFSALFRQDRTQALRLFGVRYVVSPEAIEAPELTLAAVATSPLASVYLYENPHALPSLSLQTQDQILPQETLTNTQRTNDTIQANVNAPTRSLLVFNETYYPGWEVLVDGKKKKLQEVSGFFQGVELDAGTHQVIFRYRPKVYYLGALSSVLTALFMILVLWRGQGIWRATKRLLPR